ncbi:dihydrofolate reductase family protein [Bdellovibrio sp. HCB117]|uniref:dihydrofolate reductase family protein n=1 Tax=Bdellovibrio sp. HCB117 TaxID=3394359 RepID=UPI0039B3A873
MRKIIGGVFQSLDGVIQAPGGPEEDPTGSFKYGGWSTSFWDERMNAAMGAVFDQPFDLLLGRRTYDIFAAHWGYLGDSDPIAASFTKCAKYVLTHGDQSLDWKNSHRVSSMEELKKIKSAEGPDLLIQGSSTLYPALFAENLIDRLFVMTFPVVLGKGKRLFGEGTPGGRLKMVQSDISSTGVIIATYEPDGKVPIGDFGLSKPSPAELQRREKIKKGQW